MADTTLIQRSLSNTTVVIDPGKLLDNSNAHEMVDTISRAQAMGYRFLIIDMHQLEFISSAGVGSILGSIETSRETGGDIILCNVSESIRAILDVLDLTDFLTIASSLKHAAEGCLNQERQ